MQCGLFEARYFSCIWRRMNMTTVPVVPGDMALRDTITSSTRSSFSSDRLAALSGRVVIGSLEREIIVVPWVVRLYVEIIHEL